MEPEEEIDAGAATATATAAFEGTPQTAADLPLVSVYGSDFRPEILAMHRAVTELGLWETLRKDKPPADKGYMFWNAPWLNRIFAHPAVDECGHSGATEAYCLRHVQYIAEHGWTAWVAEFQQAQ